MTKANPATEEASSQSLDNPLSEPCIMVIFGASGDLTKRLLVPSLYNLACDGLLLTNYWVAFTSRAPTLMLRILLG
jgi:glucose-6-phosphate 1-dehydrogenase